MPQLLSTMLMLISVNLTAAVKYNWNPSDSSTQIGFSLQNQSDYLVQFQIYNESAGAYHRHIFEISPDGEYGIKINTNVQTKLKIYYCPDAASGACSELNLPKAAIVEATFPLGKTIYISWDGAELLPQNEGTTAYATASGYFLTDNVQKTDYKITKTMPGDKTYPQEDGRDPWSVFPTKAQEYAQTLKPIEIYTDGTLSKFVLGLGGTPTEEQIDQAWATISTRWNPDDHPEEPNFARAVMRIINRSRSNLLDPVVKSGQ